MKLNKRSVKLTLGMLGCVAVLALGARLTEDVVPASAELDDRPVIVLDAGQGEYVLSGVAIRIHNTVLKSLCYAVSTTTCTTQNQ